MFKNLAKWGLGGISLAVIIFLGGGVDFNALFSAVDPAAVFFWIAISLIARVIQAEISYVTIKEVGGLAGRVELFYVGWVRSFLNQIMPVSGLIYYGDYLKRKRGLSWANISSLSVPQFFMSLIAMFLFTGCILLQGGDDTMLYGVFFITLFCMFALVFFYLDRIAALATWFPKFRVDPLAFGFFTNRPLLFLKILVLQFICVLLRSVRVFILFYFAYPQADFLSVAALSVIGDFAMLAQVTPGGIGIREAVMIAFAYPADFDLARVGAILLVERGLMIILVLVFFFPSIRYLKRVELK